jgi:uncharacterized damage-inducible protein DinB
MDQCEKCRPDGGGSRHRSGPPPIGEWSLQETLVHTLSAELGWRHAWEGQEHAAPIQPTDFPDAASLSARWREEEAAMRAYLGSLSDEDALVALYDAPFVLWESLTHLAHHGMPHRSEAAMLLTHFGRSPGEIDMVFWLEART